MSSGSRFTLVCRLTAALALPLLLLLPGVVRASTQHQPLRSASLKSLALRLSDIQHVYGSGLTASSAGSTKKSIDVACANVPTIDFANGFSTSNGAAVHKNGLLSITAVLTQYKTASGPRCNFASDLGQRKTLGAALGGVVSKLNGVGQQAVLIRLDPQKNEPGSPVYALDARFIRGRYLVLVVVQMNRKVRPSDVTALARAVDSRVKHSG